MFPKLPCGQYIPGVHIVLNNNFLWTNGEWLMGKGEKIRRGKEKWENCNINKRSARIDKN